MRSFSFADTNLLLAAVTVLALLLVLSLPEFLSFFGHRLAEVWWFLRQIF